MTAPSTTTADLDALIDALTPAQREQLRSQWPEPRYLALRLRSHHQLEPTADTNELAQRLLADTAQHAYFQNAFAAMLLNEPRLRGGRVLDIGCGRATHGAVRDVSRLAGQLDGVDPSPAIHEHPALAQRWQAPFESAPIPAGAYDLAFAFNVVEHIADPRPFFSQVKAILKPGGVFWALTPNARHLFARLSRGVELLGLKAGMARRSEGINPYPSYYRLNSPRSVRRAIRGLGFASAEFHFFHTSHWLNYLPRGTRWIGRAHDATACRLFPSRRVILAYRLCA